MTPPYIPATDAKSQVFLGSGNVFRDLGLLNPDLLLAKATLVQQIRELIEQRRPYRLKLGKSGKLRGCYLGLDPCLPAGPLFGP